MSETCSCESYKAVIRGLNEKIEALTEILNENEKDTELYREEMELSISRLLTSNLMVVNKKLSGFDQAWDSEIISEKFSFFNVFFLMLSLKKNSTSFIS